MGAAAAQQLDYSQAPSTGEVSPPTPVEEPLRTDLVVITAKVPRHVREALQEMSTSTGVPLAKLLRRGIERVLLNPPVVPGEPDQHTDQLELEEAALELKARKQLAEAKRVLKRIAAWRKKRASTLEASGGAQAEQGTSDQGGTTAG